MTRSKAQSYAEEQLNTHGLTTRGWTFSFNRAKRMWGLCNREKKEVQISKVLLPLMTDEQAKDTILHEIAHALTPAHYQPHGPKWKAYARYVGAKPERCGEYASEEQRQAVAALSKYTIRCQTPGCSYHTERDRKLRPNINVYAYPRCYNHSLKLEKNPVLKDT